MRRKAKRSRIYVHCMYLVVGVVADGVSEALEHGVQKVRLQERHLLNLHVLL